MMSHTHPLTREYVALESYTDWYCFAVEPERQKVDWRTELGVDVN